MGLGAYGQARTALAEFEHLAIGGLAFHRVGNSLNALLGQGNSLG